MSKPNITVSHSGHKNQKGITVGGVSWGFALREGPLWSVYKNSGGPAVATADSFRSIEFSVMGLL